MSDQAFEGRKGASAALIYLMVFLSGFAGLVYQILWMKQLGFLFGSTSQAAGATLAAFFAGLAVGSWFWGKRAEAASNPMRVYAGLELGIVSTAVLYFVVLWLFFRIYPAVYRAVGAGALLLVIKFLFALVLVFPPAFCMGGTIPIIGQALIRNKARFGIEAAWLYGINTLGAALGAFLAGFCFVRLFGFKMTCIGAMAVTATVAVTAYLLSRNGTQPVPKTEEDKPKTKKGGKKKGKQPAGRGPIYAVCFLSGFGVLALEVLWTRMFAQVHENSIYSFSSVLVIVLIALALGALVASGLARLQFPPIPILACLLMTGGLAIGTTPFLFKHMTNDLQMLDAGGTFAGYVLNLYLKGAIFIGLPALLLGTIFPFLMKTEERFSFHPGLSLGRLSAVNTVGAIIGAVLCGFVLLSVCGLWGTMQLIAVLYVIAGVLVPISGIGTAFITKGVGVGVVLLLLTGLNPAGLRTTGWDPARSAGRVLEVWETSDCTVSVVLDSHGSRVVKINSHYHLGSTAAELPQVFQGKLPLFIYPKTRSVFFLGMGTGMSAGGALDPQFKDLERVVVCELVPEVVTAAEKYMTDTPVEGLEPIPDLTNGLFEDQRVEIVVEDGRHYLMANDSTFDMINADLFLPYRSGAGSLYSREHFENVKAKLNPGGVFVQWLPMYQITKAEFGTIAKTMLSVFEQVTLWRNNFQPGNDALALVGHGDATPIPESPTLTPTEKNAVVAGMTYRDLNKLPLPMNQQTLLLFYCGNVTAAKEMFAEYPINTDDRPVIEYSAPLSIRKRRKDDLPHTLVGPPLAELVDRILATCPPAIDPMLAKRNAEDRRLPMAGAAAYRTWVGQVMGDRDQTRKAWNRFVKEWTNGRLGAR